MAETRFPRLTPSKTPLSSNFGNTDAVWAQGDLNADGSVDFDDFLILASHFGNFDLQFPINQLFGNY